MTDTIKIAVLGAGAWGTALANTLSKNNDVHLWGRDENDVESINSSHENARYLSGIKLHSDLLATSDIQQSLGGCGAVLLVTPVKTTSIIGSHIFQHISSEIPIICCAKGIDPETGKTPSQMLLEVNSNANVLVLSGPSFAADVVRGLPTAVVLAHSDIAVTEYWAANLSSEKFRIYAHDDILGVELGGAIKNVIALAVGVCRGMKLGASAEAAVISRGFSETSRLVSAMGGQATTLSGLSGMGDLVLSCSNEKSRNFSYGIALGQGDNLTDLPLAEGVRTAQTVTKLSKQHNIECPIMDGVAALLNQEISTAKLVDQLLNRPLTRER